MRRPVMDASMVIQSSVDYQSFSVLFLSEITF